MKLLRIGEAGSERPAVLVDETTALDVSTEVSDFDGEFFASGGVARLSELVDGAGADRFARVELGSVRIGAPIARPQGIWCIGLNYEDHAAEAGMPVPEEPVVFTKATNTLVGPNDDIEIPRGGDRTDWEVELAIVVGRRCHYLADVQEAADAIAGFAVANDVSERAFQLERGGQWTKGKSSPTFNPLGPWLVTPDEIADVGNLALGLDLNGEPVQAGSTSRMVFDVYHVVHYLSQFMALEPGDLINTGTPPGVGMSKKPPRFLVAGDVVEPWIDGLGRQRSTLVGPR